MRVPVQDEGREQVTYRFASSLLISNLLILLTGVSSPSAQGTSSLLEDIEWTWEVRPTHYNPKLPNVLLLGDSITRNYYPAVARRLAGKANAYLMATSASVGDPRLPLQIADFATAQAVQFSLVHFNNGMHGWVYTESQYEHGFPSFLRAIQDAAPGARLIWATTTPVKVDASPGPTNSRIEARNAIAKTLVQKAAVLIDDQHELMMHHLDTYEDTIHFNENGAEIQGAQAAATMERALPK
jgi:lysophospholipase L1-like esterase